MTLDRVGPFALGRRIEQGGGEELWLAERVTGDRSPRFAFVRRAADPQDRAAALRISAEYDALRSVDDPRLPRALGHFAGQAALAVGWAPGPTLADAVRAHREGLLTLDAATVLDLVGEVAEALRHAHGRRGPDGRPLVHAHLEPCRVRLAPDGSVTVLGLGRQVRPRAPGALAPELLSGGAPTARSDQWALGAMLVEMLTGTALYQGPDGPADLGLRREGRVGPWIEPVARVNPALGRLLARLLAVDPAARFDDEGELVRTLQALRRGLPGVADRGGLAERLALLGRGPAIVPEPRAGGPEPRAGGPEPRAGGAEPRAGGAHLPGPGLDRPTDLPAQAGPFFDPEESLTLPLRDQPDLSSEPDELTEPLDEPPPPRRRPLLAPATRQRLGLGEGAAIIALVLLAAVAVVALVLRG